MSLFRRNKTDIHSLQLPDLGWEATRDEKDIRMWLNPSKTVALSVNFFSEKPDLQTMQNIEVLRRIYRTQLAEVNGGLVEVEFAELGGFSALMSIFKIPQDPKGTTYLGSFTLPFHSCSYVVKLQAVEAENQGGRDASLSGMLLMQNVIHKSGQELEGWLSDPYDPDFKGGTLMNKGEEAQYDVEFPAHPLSLVRKHLADIMAGIQFSDAMHKLKPFGK